MLEKLITLNNNINKLPRPIKKIDVFSNGYYMLTTDDKYEKTDEESVDFVKICSSNHVILKGMSENAVGAFPLSEAGNNFYVTKVTSGGAYFDREIWTCKDKQFFQKEFICQTEFCFNDEVNKIGFNPYNDEDKYFMVGDLICGLILKRVNRGDEAEQISKKHGIKNDFCLFNSNREVFKKLSPDSFVKSEKQVENSVKNKFPRAIVASNSKFLCAADNNLFYYFDLKKLEELKIKLYNFKNIKDLFGKTKRSDLVRYYISNYEKMFFLIKKSMVNKSI